MEGFQWRTIIHLLYYVTRLGAAWITRQPNLDLSPSHHQLEWEEIQGEGEGFLAGAKKMHSLSLWVLAC